MNEHWTELILGAWVMVSPWLLGFATISVAKWSNLIVGLALVLVNAWTIFGAPSAPHDRAENKK